MTPEEVEIELLRRIAKCAEEGRDARVKFDHEANYVIYYGPGAERMDLAAMHKDKELLELLKQWKKLKPKMPL